jgi:putative addiction module killer protein
MKETSTKKLLIYTNEAGKSPFEDWLKSLKDKIIRARIQRRLDFLQMGHYGDYKSLGDGIFELRLAFGSGFRIYFAEVNEAIVLLLSGGNKASQNKDIKIAKSYWQETQGDVYD